MNEIATTKDFQQRMFEKIRDQMGDLLTDEDLKKIVGAAVQKAFFEPQITRDQWGHPRQDDPALIKMLRELLRDRVNAACKEWIEANSVEVADRVTEELKRAVPAAILSLIKSTVDGNMFALMNELRGKGVL